MCPVSSITTIASGTVSRIDRRWAAALSASSPKLLYGIYSATPGCGVAAISSDVSPDLKSWPFCRTLGEGFTCGGWAMTQGKRVHVVDDEESIRRSLDFLLRTTGFEVEKW